jgi:hypothetical protein
MIKPMVDLRPAPAKAPALAPRLIVAEILARLEAFLLQHGSAIPRTTLRYAIERFSAAKRKTLLKKTKGEDS